MMRLADCLDPEDAHFERVFAANHGWAEALYYAPRPYTHLSCKALEACGERDTPSRPKPTPREPAITITAHGVTRTVKEWARMLGYQDTTIYRRLLRGKTGAAAVGKPVYLRELSPERRRAFAKLGAAARLRKCA